MKFAYIDVFIFGGFVLAAFLGYRSGVMRKVINLLVLVGSIVLATSLMTTIGGTFVDAGILSERVAFVTGFSLGILIPMLATFFLYRRFGSQGMVKSSSQIAGMVLGALEGLLVIGLVLICFKVFDAPGEETRLKSLLYRPAVNIVPRSMDLLGAYLPGASDFREEFTGAFKKPDLFEAKAAPGPGKKK